MRHVITSSRRRVTGGVGSAGTVAFSARGNTANGTTSLSVPHPSGTTSAGNYLIIFVSLKPETPTPSTPSGWTLLSTSTGGKGAAGIDAGFMKTVAYGKIAAGGETGNVSITLTGGNVAQAWMMRFTKSAGASWDIAASNATFDASSAPVAPSSNNTIRANSSSIAIEAGDAVVAWFGINTDAGAATLGGSVVFTASGITLGAIDGDSDSSITGNDMRVVATWAQVTAGNNTTTMQAGFSLATQTANSPAGAVIFLRLRAVA